jgi:valyl-tRNA synthetase
MAEAPAESPAKLPTEQPNELAKAYEPADVEKRWLEYWLESGCFRADDVSDKPSFCIVIPPPNVTGSLHMGHAMDNTLQDILVRWHRMSGDNTLWMPGTDHAGIITEIVMERMLAEEGTDRYELGREEFIRRMWQWKDESRGTIVGQLKRLGASCDWDRERFTMDDDYIKAVPVAFKRLYEAGCIYRGEEMVNWIPSLRTSVSDLEVEHEERRGKLYHVRYPVKGSDRELIIATTRPETMLGDTAIAVHPDDERYSDLVGGTAILPIVGRELRIIADDYVDREFGTGALKVTPGHDPNDYEIGKRHDLERIDILNEDATISETAGHYVGLDRFECRKRIVADLEAAGNLVKIEDHTHAVSISERTGEPVEPLVATGWFMRMGPMAEASIKAVHDGDITIIPGTQGASFLRWMENIRDWPLSRMRWWGHRIPAWYTPEGDIIVAENEAEAKTIAAEKYGADYGTDIELRQDPDVFDTWFSSGLWPLVTLGWPDKECDTFKTFFPTNVLVTGWDIIFFWVSRMVNLTLELEGEAPFQTVYLHPLLMGDDGKKMSKSRGNMIEALTMMDKYGTDAFRLAIAATMIEAPWMQLQEGRIEGYRNFTNKLWNAARFTLMQLKEFEPQADPDLELETADLWIRSRLNTVAATVADSLERFRFADAATALYDFVWHEFCDWYIEIAKLRLYGDASERESYTVRHVLHETLDGVLRLLHPFMPFVTEEIWQHTPHDGDTICRAPYPVADDARANPSAEEQMTLVMDVIRSIRNVRGEMNVPPGREITALVHTAEQAQRDTLTAHAHYVRSLAKLGELDVAECHEKPRAAAAAVAGSVETYIPLEGAINIDDEIARLGKEVGRVEKELERLTKNLANENFINRAPAEVVERDRTRKTELEGTREALQRNLALLTE